MKYTPVVIPSWMTIVSGLADVLTAMRTVFSIPLSTGTCIYLEVGRAHSLTFIEQQNTEKFTPLQRNSMTPLKGSLLYALKAIAKVGLLKATCTKSKLYLTAAAAYS